MKRVFAVAFLLFVFIGCKKNGMSPDGPTDVRVRNISNMAFKSVVVSTSEKQDDSFTFGDIASGDISGYHRFKKAYPKAAISAIINIGGTDFMFSTGDVDYTYMNYIGQDKITFEVYISDLSARKITISNVILEEPL